MTYLNHVTSQQIQQTLYKVGTFYMSNNRELQINRDIGLYFYNKIHKNQINDKKIEDTAPSVDKLYITIVKHLECAAITYSKPKL